MRPARRPGPVARNPDNFLFGGHRLTIVGGTARASDLNVGSLLALVRASPRRGSGGIATLAGLF